VALPADAGRLDLRDCAQHVKGRKHIIGARRKRILRLVGDGGAHSARTEGVENERGDANPRQGLRMGQVRGGDTEAARDHDHQRHRLGVRGIGGQEELAVDGDARHLGWPADGLEVVAGRGRGNGEVAPDAAVGEDDAAFAKAGERCCHGARDLP
jgi:hypothetical protein